jgi:acetyl/propionyl-CoA carboxylase alpha subunit
VLAEYAVEGVRTTIPFFRAVVQSEEFRRGEFDTGFIDRFLKGLANENLSRDEQEITLEDVALIASVLHARASVVRELRSPSATESRWKLHARLAQRK